MRRRVPALAVGLPDLPDCQQLLAEQRVHERRLPDPRRAEQGDRLSRLQVGADDVEPVSRQAGDRVHWHAERDRLDLEHLQLDILGEVGLRQHDHGLRTAFPRQRQIALQPAQVQILVQRAEQEDGVDVRCDDLLLRRRPGDLARERRPSRQHGLDRPGLLERAVSDGHPVADRREVAEAVGLVERRPAGSARISPSSTRTT